MLRHMMYYCIHRHIVHYMHTLTKAHDVQYGYFSITSNISQNLTYSSGKGGGCGRNGRTLAPPQSDLWPTMFFFCFALFENIFCSRCYFIPTNTQNLYTYTIYTITIIIQGCDEPTMCHLTSGVTSLKRGQLQFEASDCGKLSPRVRTKRILT